MTSFCFSFVNLQNGSHTNTVFCSDFCAYRKIKYSLLKCTSRDGKRRKMINNNIIRNKCLGVKTKDVKEIRHIGKYKKKNSFYSPLSLFYL